MRNEERVIGMVMDNYQHSIIPLFQRIRLAVRFSASPRTRRRQN
jgi:hypothetical protein